MSDEARMVFILRDKRPADRSDRHFNSVDAYRRQCFLSRAEFVRRWGRSPAHESPDPARGAEPQSVQYPKSRPETKKAPP